MPSRPSDAELGATSFGNGRASNHSAMPGSTRSGRTAPDGVADQALLVGEQRVDVEEVERIERGLRHDR